MRTKEKTVYNIAVEYTTTFSYYIMAESEEEAKEMAYNRATEDSADNADWDYADTRVTEEMTPHDARRRDIRLDN